MPRTAIVLFNLGGPDSLDSVEPFLRNLFSDPAIISLPGPLRRLVARMISRRRGPIAREIYRKIGGKSPLVEETRAQADALQSALADLGEVKVFMSMRYWHPMSMFTIEDVKEFAPDRVVLLPLYPQFSTTTTKSSTIDWFRSAIRSGVKVPTVSICCYPRETGLADALAALIKPHLEEAAAHGKPRLLLSAHGLPKKIVAKGDPYQWQVEQTAAAVIARLDDPALDWRVCYQSRVGPMAWIGPSTDDEIARAGADKVPLVVVPIAFVSEHSETLVELDIEYRELALRLGVPHFGRVAALGINGTFIASLADLVRRSLADAPAARDSMCAGEGDRICPAHLKGCPLAARAA